MSERLFIRYCQGYKGMSCKTDQLSSVKYRSAKQEKKQYSNSGYWKYTTCEVCLKFVNKETGITCNNNVLVA